MMMTNNINTTPTNAIYTQPHAHLQTIPITTTHTPGRLCVRHELVGSVHERLSVCNPVSNLSAGTSAVIPSAPIALSMCTRGRVGNGRYDVVMNPKQVTSMMMMTNNINTTPTNAIYTQQHAHLQSIHKHTHPPTHTHTHIHTYTHTHTHTHIDTHI